MFEIGKEGRGIHSSLPYRSRSDAIHRNTIQCNTILCYAILCYAMLCYTMLYHATLYIAIIRYTVLTPQALLPILYASDPGGAWVILGVMTPTGGEEMRVKTRER